MDFSIRPLKFADLDAIASIQSLNPTGSQWNPADYLAYLTLVVEVDARVVAFIAALDIPPAECEILNLAVHPDFKRHGLATALLKSLPARSALLLDVRISNLAAIAFYKKHGFVKTGHRRKYYSRPTEDAIMMTRRASPQS